MTEGYEKRVKWVGGRFDNFHPLGGEKNVRNNLKIVNGN
jgi:hypothetical protein